MSFDQSFLRADAEGFLARTLPAPGPVWEKVERAAAAERQPVVGRVTGGLLRSYVQAHGARRVLEVGTNLGASTLWMASAVGHGGRVDTIEMDAEMARRARGIFDEAGLGARVRVLEGRALDVLPTLPSGSYDVAFLDAAKSEYPEYLDHAIRCVRGGGLILADNVLWHGRVWDDAHQDDDTRGVREYVRRMFEDDRLVSTIVPAEDGLGVSVVVG